MIKMNNNDDDDVAKTNTHDMSECYRHCLESRVSLTSSRHVHTYIGGKCIT